MQRQGIEKGVRSSHTLPGYIALPASPLGHQPRISLHPVLLGFYGGFITYIGTIDSIISRWAFLNLHPTPSPEVRRWWGRRGGGWRHCKFQLSLISITTSSKKPSSIPESLLPQLSVLLHKADNPFLCV